MRETKIKGEKQRHIKMLELKIAFFNESLQYMQKLKCLVSYLHNFTHMCLKKPDMCFCKSLETLGSYSNMKAQ